MNKSVSVSILIVALSSTLIVGCDQDQKPSTLTSAPAVRKFKQATQIGGAVQNNSGVAKTGKVEVIEEKGHKITETMVKDGHFSLEIPADTALPLLLTYSAEDGKDKMVAAVIYDTVTRYYINPSTTAIAKAAKEMGGYTRANLDRATENTVHVPDSNKTSAGWRGDPTTQYGGWH